ncbi:MAG: S8 family serine peptidase [Actinophytocola sp.]|uniref:cyanobactin maturation protease PatG family protein n=1 Tax=Actinophytocola sp. TaxID=1872138 RepID=UPI003C75258B
MSALTVEAIPGVRELWRHTLGDPDVTIGMVESVPDLDHPCFDGARLTLIEPRWLPRIDPIKPYREHATFVASQLFGQPNSPAPGLAPRCRGVIVPILRDEATTLDPLNAARAVETLVEAGADIIHFAGASPTLSGDTEDLLKRAIRRAAQNGVLIVAPAGNEYGERRSIPAVLPEVLAVGAHDADGAMMRFSNWGPAYAGHGIVAPGDNLRAALVGGGTVVHKGTSVAAPIVSGVAALLESLRRRHGLPPDPRLVGRELLASARPCEPDQVHGEPDRCLSGRLNVPAATRRVLADLPGVGASALPAVMSRAFALGTLDYDFGTEERLEQFTKAMARFDPPLNPHKAPDMITYLGRAPDASQDLIWTLNQDQGPIYALEPHGSYGDKLYELLRALLAAQVARRIERISVPGRLEGGMSRLQTGQNLPVLGIEVLRGIYGWSTESLVDDALGPDHDPEVHTALRQFLDTVYYELANRGTASRNRALNFAATNPLQAAQAITAATAAGMKLADITVAKSPYCRMGSDCQEVKLRFHDPADGSRASWIWRFTIDVGDLLPVTVGEPRAWPEI